MKRRTLALATGGVLAATAGAGTAWWVGRRNAPSAPAGNGDAFWPLRFERPDGSELAAVSLRGRPLLLNFWATWCPPCVEELPLLDRFEREQRAQGWRVLALAIDRAEPVRKFLDKHPLGFAVALGGAQGFELVRQLGNTAGGLPFTAIFDSAGRLVDTKLGAVTPDELSAWARRVR
jgi:thiol-disulfide isomerase/thioredoxin